MAQREHKTAETNARPERQPAARQIEPTVQPTSLVPHLPAPSTSSLGPISSGQPAAVQRRTSGATPGSPAALRQMQRQYGNRAVQRMVARAQQGAGPSEVAPAVAQGIQHARGAGRPLDAHLRAQFEPAFGHDFQHVRVHTDSHADTLSRALHARAFATGRDLFFRHGEYNPGSSAGRELLAHELTHVVQQHGVAPSAALTLSQPGDESEREAEHVARAVMQREQVAPQAAPSQIQRQTADGAIDATAQMQAQAQADAHRIRAILQGNTWLGRYNQRDIMAIVEQWASQSNASGGRQTPFDLLIAALRQSTFQVGTLASQLTSTFDQLFARLSSENAARLQTLIQTRAHTFRGEKALELARFEVSKDDVLDAAQLSAEVAAAFATGGGSVLAQIVIWLGTTLPGLYRKASAVINFVETLRNLKLDDVQKLFSAQGLGNLLVRALFGELPPLATVAQEREEDAESGGGREEKGLVRVFHSMIRAFRALRGVYGSVVEVINKNLARINITGAAWFERFSMVYAGIVQAANAIDNPGAVLRDAAGSLRDVVGNFFGSIKAKVGDVAAMLTDQLKQISNPTQLMQRLADKAVEMVLNFIVTHPPSALVKVAFKAIETGAKMSIVELVRQHIPFADRLIQRIAQSEAVTALLRPLEGPATAVSGATERVAGAAGGLVNDVESRVGALVSDGAQMVKQLSGIDIEAPAAQPADQEQAAAASRPQAGGAGPSGAGVLGVVAQGLHARLLAIGTRNLLARGRALGKATLETGLAAGRNLAGKIRGLLIGEVVDFEAGGEQHQLWVEERSTAFVPMMASEPIKIAEKAEAYRAGLNDLRNPVQRRNAETLVDQLVQLNQRMMDRANRAAARMRPLKAAATNTIAQLEAMMPLQQRFVNRPSGFRPREDVLINPTTGTVQITSLIGPPVPRLEFEDMLAGPGSVGLPGWHRAHLVGPGTGKEFAAGILYAPLEFNLTYHKIVEIMMQDLYLRAEASRAANPGRRIEVWQRCTAIPFDRTTRRLREGKYEIFLTDGSRTVLLATMTITVDEPTPSRPLPAVHPVVRQSGVVGEVL